jgi:hypothetical protein
MAEEKVVDDYLDLIRQANTIFRRSFPAAFTYGCVGLPVPGKRAKSESDLKTWIFLASDKRSFLQLRYENGQFGQPEHRELTVGLEYVTLPQGTIRLTEAIRILNNNGFVDGFSGLSMGTPAEFQPQPMFWFCIDGFNRGVSASTGEFFRKLYACPPGELNLPPAEPARSS